MKSVLVLAIATLLAVSGASSANVSDPHAGHVSATTSATPATPATPAQRWPTDAPLRTGLREIRVAVDALDHGVHGHLDDAQVVALATRVDQQIAYLVANCKLEPRADAALHVIIAKLGAGARALREDPGNRDAIGSMQSAVASYPQQFDDPTWASVEEPEESR